MAKNLYTVAEMAAEAGVSEGLIYQGFKNGKIKAATEEEMRENGINPETVRKPARWIMADEVERYINLPRKSAWDYTPKPNPK